MAAAPASGSVHTALEMPFDLRDLLDALAAATFRRPAESRLLAQPLEGDYTLRRAADVLGSAASCSSGSRSPAPRPHGV